MAGRARGFVASVDVSEVDLLAGRSSRGRRCVFALAQATTSFGLQMMERARCKMEAGGGLRTAVKASPLRRRTKTGTRQLWIGATRVSGHWEAQCGAVPSRPNFKPAKLGAVSGRYGCTTPWRVGRDRLGLLQRRWVAPRGTVLAGQARCANRRQHHLFHLVPERCESGPMGRLWRTTMQGTRRPLTPTAPGADLDVASQLTAGNI